MASFYMGRFGAASPKRHRVWSNDVGLLAPLAQRAGYMSRQEQQQCGTKTTTKYTDKHGVRRHVGNKEALRQSQHLARCDQKDFPI